MTAQDLADKWDEIKQAARGQAERRVLGVTILTAGGIALGLGALATAFVLGRRSAAPRHEVVPAEPAPAPEEKPTPRSEVVRSLQPALTSALTALVNAGAKAAVSALTKRLEGDESK
ncbi:MAG: hypothetical protein KKI08_23830 [Armatimonadetes bacterium]|nr:hypothetical protein [Armatimonadota bacterium]